MSTALLIDLHAIFCRFWFASADQEIGTAYEGTISRVRNAAEGYEFVAVCYDWPPYNRKQISETYKANRDKTDPSMIAQLARVKERLTADGFLLWGSLGFEADDIIATAVRALLQNTQHTIDVLSQDKDLMCLVGKRVNQILLSDGSRFDEAKVIEKMGVAPRKVSELLALSGDKSDNVSGCPGCGPKKAAALLAEHGSLATVLTLAGEGDKNNKLKPPALRQALIDHVSDVSLSWDLVTLDSSAPIKVDEIFEKREVKTLKPQVKDAEFEEDEHGDAWEGDEFPIPGDHKASESMTPPAPVVLPPVVTIGATPPVVTIDEKVQASVAPTSVKNEKPTPAKEKSPEAKPSAAMVVYNGSFELQLEPQSMNQCFLLANHLMESRKLGFGRAEEAEAIIIAGRELGLPAMASLRTLFISRDKVCMSGACVVALVLRSGMAEYFELDESDSEHAVYVTKRKGGRKEHFRGYSVEEARKVGLVKPSSGWVNYPQNMCEWRAAAFLARSIYPDVMFGLYTKEEMDDIS